MKVSCLAVAAVSLISASPSFVAQVDISSGSVVAIVGKLQAGQYVWAPQVAPDGPMLFIVNLKTQRAVLYRNGVPVGATTISTGRSGHETPTGIFTILQKQVVHHSSKYDNAPMPYMERLTWQGVALHAGKLPGFPASHGCIRMPAGFAKLLYGLTSLGMTVVIANAPATPRIAPTPTLAWADAESPLNEGSFTWTPDKSPGGPVSVIVSASDRRALVLRNGIVIGSAPVTVKADVAGTWAYQLKSIDKDGQHWVRLRLSLPIAGDQQVPLEEWQKFVAPEGFKKAVATIAAPGMTVVVTPDSLRSAAAPTTILESGH